VNECESGVRKPLPFYNKTRVRSCALNFEVGVDGRSGALDFDVGVDVRSCALDIKMCGTVRRCAFVCVGLRCAFVCVRVRLTLVVCAGGFSCAPMGLPKRGYTCKLCV